jgi:hypothetical protein
MADTSTPIAGQVFAWERGDWIFSSPPSDDLPSWLAEQHALHTSALNEYYAAISGVVNLSEKVGADARAWRRSVRDALADGRTPPVREQTAEHGEAAIEIAADDAEHARRELAFVCLDILTVLREHMDDFAPYFGGASAELRFALGRGPDGLTEDERKRRERLVNVSSEPAVPDVDEHPELANLGQQEVHDVAAA